MINVFVLIYEKGFLRIPVKKDMRCNTTDIISFIILSAYVLAKQLIKESCDLREMIRLLAAIS